jgi:quinoprotein glucose dehydrogenase
MNAGEILWQVANGEGVRDHPLLKDLNLPRLGFPGHAAPLVTRTLLFAGEGSTAMLVAGGRIPPEMPVETAPNYAEPWFRAYDKATGEIVAELELPGGTTGAPMTYMHEGKQFIVVAVGGQDTPPEWVGLSLP